MFINAPSMNFYPKTSYKNINKSPFMILSTNLMTMKYYLDSFSAREAQE